MFSSPQFTLCGSQSNSGDIERKKCQVNNSCYHTDKVYPQLFTKVPFAIFNPKSVFIEFILNLATNQMSFQLLRPMIRYIVIPAVQNYL